MLNTTQNLSPKWQDLATENEIAHLRADLCLSDPDSYTLAEKHEICEQIDASNNAIDAALRASFQADPPELQAANRYVPVIRPPVTASCASKARCQQLPQRR